MRPLVEKITKDDLTSALQRRLRLREPRFELERTPNGKWSGSVVSQSFARYSGLERQQRIWRALDSEIPHGRSKEIVGILLAYTPEEWDIDLQGAPAPRRRRSGNGARSGK